MSKTSITKRKTRKINRPVAKKSDSGVLERALMVITQPKVVEKVEALIAASGDGKIPHEDLEKMRVKAVELASFTPTVCFFGRSKTGRSSICRNIFSKDHIEISSVEACAGQHKPLRVPGSRNDKMRIINMPEFIPEDGGDDSYVALCEESLSRADVVLWALKAGDTKGIDAASWKLVRPIVENLSLPIVFVLTQVDAVDPSNEWVNEKNLPSAKQMGNILIEKKSISKEFNIPAHRIVAVSVNKKFALSDLLITIIQSVPDEKKAGFSIFTNPAFRTGKLENEAEGGFIEALGVYLKETGSAVYDFFRKNKRTFYEVFSVAVQVLQIVSQIRGGGSASSAPQKPGKV